MSTSQIDLLWRKQEKKKSDLQMESQEVDISKDLSMV